MEALIQPMELYEGGFGSVEAVSLQDAAIQCGIIKVVIRDGSSNYSKNQIVELLRKEGK